MSAARKRHAFVAEAILLRRLHAYREALGNAQDDGLTLSDQDLPRFALMPSAEHMPSFSDMARRYDRLLDDWVPESPHDIEGVMAYLDLVGEIIAGELRSRYEPEAANPIPVERDFVYALELLSRVQRWLNEKDATEERVKWEGRS